MSFKIVPVRTDDDLNVIAELFLAYQRDLGVDLTFQNFEDELAALPGEYAPPRGEALLARLTDGTPVGCVAMRPLSETGVCEMKRMFVPPPGRGKGIGRALAGQILDVARVTGYHTMKLDTLPRLRAALKIYEELGFAKTDAYYDNPIDGVIYLASSL